MAMLTDLLASSSWLPLTGVLISPWGNFCERPRTGSTFTIRSDLMRGSITSPRSTMLSRTGWRIFLLSPYCDVYFSRDWTKRPHPIFPRIAQRDVSYKKEMVGSDRIERDEKERMTSPLIERVWNDRNREGRISCEKSLSSTLSPLM